MSGDDPDSRPLGTFRTPGYHGAMSHSGVLEQHPDGDASGAVPTLLGLVLFATEVLVLPAAGSPFRLPKLALATAGIVLVLGVAAAVRSWHGRLRLPRSGLAAAIAAYPLLLALSALWAASPRRALTAAALAACWSVATLILGGLGATAIDRLVPWAVTGLALSVVVMLLQTVGLSPLLTLPHATGRLSRTGLTGNPADLAAAALLLVPLLVLPSSGRRRSRWRLGLAAILLAGVASTQTLTAFAGLAILLLLWLVRQRSRKVRLAAVAAAGLLLAIALSAGLSSRLGWVIRNARKGSWGAVLSGRTDGWTAAAEMIRDHPVRGVGAANYGQLFFPARLSWLERHGTRGGRGELATHFEWAHCDPLQVLTELGVLGLAWLIVIAVALRRHPARGDPALHFFAAAAVPFLLFHYPTHLAVGLIPVVLLGGRLLAAEPVHTRLPSSTAKPLAIVLVAAAVVVAAWQYRTVTSSIWYPSVERATLAATRLPDDVRRRALAGAEKMITDRLARQPAEAPELLRLLGKTQLALGENDRAVATFTRAGASRPHAGAELGLGLALAGQGRLNEALPHLESVCRVNQDLTTLIHDPQLREELERRIRRWPQ